MPGTVLMIGTRKGLGIARSDDRESWDVSGPDDVMGEVHAVADRNAAVVPGHEVHLTVDLDRAAVLTGTPRPGRRPAPSTA